MGGMDGISTDQLFEKWNRDIPIYMFADFCYWPPVQFFNFRLVQLKYQSLLVYCATFVFTLVMSAIESREISQADLEGIKEELDSVEQMKE